MTEDLPVVAKHLNDRELRELIDKMLEALSVRAVRRYYPDRKSYESTSIELIDTSEFI